MTMTNEEICRDYRTAKAPMKQIGILAELNQCDKNRIKKILIDGGEKLPGNMVKKPKKQPEPVTSDEVKRVMEDAPVMPLKAADDVIPVKDALPLLIGCAAAHVINKRAADMSEADVTAMMDFCQFTKGVMALLEEVVRRCERGA